MWKFSSYYSNAMHLMFSLPRDFQGLRERGGRISATHFSMLSTILRNRSLDNLQRVLK